MKKRLLRETGYGIIVLCGIILAIFPFLSDERIYNMGMVIFIYPIAFLIVFIWLAAKALRWSRNIGKGGGRP